MLTVSVHVSEQWRAAVARQWEPQVGVRMIQQIENVLSKKNWPKVMAVGQGEWKPLTPKYARWKASRGYPVDIWRLRDRTSKALTTTIKVGQQGGQVMSREILITGNAAGKVSGVVSVKAPAAGGYFEKNNAVRRIMYVLPEMAQKATDGCVKVVMNWLRAHGLKIQGSGSFNLD